MPEMQFTEKQIGRILHELHRERAPYLRRMAGRRLLLNLASDKVDDPLTGTWLPDPFDKSTLIIRSLMGDISDVLNNYKARIAANEPQISVIPVASTKKGTVTKTVDEQASEQERLLQSQWLMAGGRAAQRQAAYSQSWGRAGWYLTLPRDASFGLPARRYFETGELTDDEIDELRRKGEIEPDPTAEQRFREVGETWLERRQAEAQENAVNGTSLFTLEEYPSDMVLPRYETDGTANKTLKYGFVIKEMPGADFLPGTEMARAAARTALAMGKEDFPDGDIDKYGIYVNDDGDIEGGLTEGGEEYSNVAKRRWTMAIFATRTEVYWYVTVTPGTSSGIIVHHEKHGADEVPLIPIAAEHTDSASPGAEFSSPMESVFASTPLINQLQTLLSNVATWNALGRFYIIQPDGTPLTDDEGELVTLTQEDLIGGDPGSVYITKGEVRQLTIDSGTLDSILQLYLERFDQNKPSPVTEGVAGATAAAWQVRQLLSASDELLQEPVDNHAEGMRRVLSIWIRWMRMLDEPVYAFSVPSARRNERSVRGLVEFDPEDLVGTIRVEQSSQNTQQRIALRAAGQEELAQGLISRERYYAEFALEQDPEAAMLDADINMISDVVLTGNLENVQAGSVFADVAQAVRGELSLELLARSPNFALAEAERMAANVAAATAPPTPGAPGDGNLSQATGTVEPGLGMPLQQAGSPDSQAPQAV